MGKTCWDFLSDVAEVIGIVLIMIFATPMGWIGLLILGIAFD